MFTMCKSQEPVEIPRSCRIWALSIIVVVIGIIHTAIVLDHFFRGHVTITPRIIKPEKIRPVILVNVCVQREQFKMENLKIYMNMHTV